MGYATTIYEEWQSTPAAASTVAPPFWDSDGKQLRSNTAMLEILYDRQGGSPRGISTVEELLTKLGT